MSRFPMWPNLLPDNKERKKNKEGISEVIKQKPKLRSSSCWGLQASTLPFYLTGLGSFW